MTHFVVQHGSKVPEVTLVFWIIKIAATTLGETFGDTVTMTLNWGYLVGMAIFFSLLIALVIWQIAVDRFRPFLYWTTIVASTTAGTTMADFADRSLGIGYAGGSSFLLVCLIAVLGMWYWSLGSISVATVTTPKVRLSTGPRSHFRKHSARRLATGWLMMPAWGMKGAHSYSPPAWRYWPSLISGRMFRGSCCSGPPLFSLDRLERQLVTSSTNLSEMAG